MIGSTIAHFRIVDQLGEGGMGIVYKAQDLSLGRFVALKVLPEHLTRDEEFVQRFHREARAVAQLNHLNIVTVHYVGREGDTHFIAMEYLEGRTLGELLKQKGKFEVRASLEILVQVLNALQAAHQRGIIHRDIKPQNIMLDSRGRVKVLDFGVAKLIDSTTANTQVGSLLGTPAYMAPEQCLGQKLDQRADLFSTGVVLFQMLAGRLPFQADSIAGIIQRIMNDPTPPIHEFNPDVPWSVERILETALAKEPADRYTLASDMADDVTRALTGGGDDLVATTGRLTPVMYGRTLAGKIAAKSRRSTRILITIAVAMVATLIFVMRMRDRSLPEMGTESGARESVQRTMSTLVPPAPIPLIEWVQAPDPNEIIESQLVRVVWRVANGVEASRFQVGLNESDPQSTVDVSAKLNLARAGRQSISIIPLSSDGTQGQALRREFFYRPPQVFNAEKDWKEGEKGPIWFFLEWTGSEYRPMRWDGLWWRGALTDCNISPRVMSPQGADAVRMWMSPQDGVAQIAGRVKQVETGCGDGVEIKIRLNDNPLWGSRLLEFNDDVGFDLALSAPVSQGDRIYFHVGQRGSHDCDAIDWDLTITLRRKGEPASPDADRDSIGAPDPKRRTDAPGAVN